MNASLSAYTVFLWQILSAGKLSCRNICELKKKQTCDIQVKLNANNDNNSDNKRLNRMKAAFVPDVLHMVCLGLQYVIIIIGNLLRKFCSPHPQKVFAKQEGKHCFGKTALTPHTSHFKAQKR